jgi:phosphoglucomutase
MGAALSALQKSKLAGLSPQRVVSTELAAECIERVLTRAPGNDAPISGIKVNAASGWFAARPSGTVDLYKICAESFAGSEHLQRPPQEAQAIVDAEIAPSAVDGVAAEPSQ